MEEFFPVLDMNLDSPDWVQIDLSGHSYELPPSPVSTAELDRFIQRQIKDQGGKYGIGGYLEDRNKLYSRGEGFETKEGEVRRIHLGIDLWAPEGTPVYSPLDARVHSLANNSSFGNYGGTLILEARNTKIPIYFLFGHLRANIIHDWRPGDFISKGQKLSELGGPEENVGWPPHLHFQCIHKLHGKTGDYPGVCTLSAQPFYKTNCPDPNFCLGSPIL